MEHWRERLRLPLVAAPMTGVSGPDLVVEACVNGIVGAFPAHNASGDTDLSSWLLDIRQRVSARTDPSSSGPIAVNVIVHPSNRRLAADIRVISSFEVELVITSVGSPAPVVDVLHDAGCEVYADVASLRHVDRALQVGVDGLVLLTAGAGGQTGWLNPFAFVRAVRGVFDGPVVLAGGIADGVALRAALTLGCDLAYMGTRFIATTESLAGADYRAALVAATPDDITLTSSVTGIPANFIADPVSDALGHDRSRKGFDYAVLHTPRQRMSAGHSVCGVSAVTSVSELIARTAAEFAAAGSAPLTTNADKPTEPTRHPSSTSTTPPPRISTCEAPRPTSTSR